MKKILLITFACGVTATANAQLKPNCEEFKEENIKLNEENKSLRNSLKLSEPIKQINNNNIDFKLLKIEGNSKEQTVTFTFLLKSSIANWSISSGINSIFDIDGNEYKLKSYKIGADSYSSTINLYTDVPIKCSYTFEGILPSVKIIKFFNFTYYENDTHSVEFRDLAIDWGGMKII